MPETTETICHWVQVQRRWKWEWASYHPHPGLFWTADGDGGTTELLEDATLAADPPDLRVDLAYGSRWEKVSGTGTDVVVGTVDLPDGIAPVGTGWRVAEPVG
ncbi:hypothetical protein [Cellulomonas carbonis]|uniref:Uncharacterized protein n=1 Tax=Cellulomonas carbonis T26 TaxID=947969 RepID=A0A0A0BY27_9CELL|nr:hypothetical protein [Cellulomonas carbonis]KGM12811.1 hypothetical protein N868_00060 [Cellulomonas carbonis T26]GGC13768.1 hypothetical protein GCM10010972_28890 [Cellulomonas carbonis]